MPIDFAPFLTAALEKGMLGAAIVLVCALCFLWVAYKLTNKLIDNKAVSDLEKSRYDRGTVTHFENVVLRVEQRLENVAKDLGDVLKKFALYGSDLHHVEEKANAAFALATSNKEEMLRHGMHIKVTSEHVGLYKTLEEEGHGLSEDYLPDMKTPKD